MQRNQHLFPSIAVRQTHISTHTHIHKYIHTYTDITWYTCFCYHRAHPLSLLRLVVTYSKRKMPKRPCNGTEPDIIWFGAKLLTTQSHRCLHLFCKFLHVNNYRRNAAVYGEEILLQWETHTLVLFPFIL